MRLFTISALACLGVLAPHLAPAQTAPTRLAPAPATLAPALAPDVPPLTSVGVEEQSRRPAAARRRPPLTNRLQIRAFGSAGTTWFTASSSFKAVLGSSTGQDFGGGINLTQGPGYLEVGARRFSKSGSRVFVSDDGQVFPLGIPTKVTMTPLDATAGWRFAPRFGRVIPHLGVGYTRMTYEETADFAEDGDDVSESFNGYHVLGGAEVRVARWVGVTGEVVWTSVADALGDGGVSKAFDENNLGGTSLRIKLVIGR